MSAPIGTHRGLVHALWTLVSGQLLASRWAVIPGLSPAGLSEPAVRQAWGVARGLPLPLERAAVQAATATDALVFDAGFEIRQLQAAEAQPYVVRAAKNVIGRRAVLADSPGRGRPRERGELVRPLSSQERGPG